MIKIVKQPGKYSLVGNSVLFEIETDSPDPVNVFIEINGHTIHLTAYPYPYNLSYLAEIDISDILKAQFDQDASIPDDNIIVSALSDFALNYSVTIGSTKLQLQAINGGISDQLASVLAEYGMNAFSYRLDSIDRSFLFTTRTNSPNIVLKESEVFPFVFLHPGKTISFKTANNRVITTPAMQKGTACLMDINTLRKTFYDLYKEISSYFQVLVEGSYTFDITLTPNRISENRHLLRFRNSLGGFEQLEITGRSYLTPEISEDYSWQTLNKRRVFEARKERNDITHKLTMESGYKTSEELFFLFDILSSELVYLIRPDQSIQRCFVKASSDMKIPYPVLTPQSITLEITPIIREKFYSSVVDFAAPGAWILETGFWNDFARWKDNKSWKDNK